jgi:hypothetical protein
VTLPISKIKLVLPVIYDPVMAALTFISIIYDPEGDGDVARSHVTLMKVTVNRKSLDNIINRQTLLKSH